VNQPAQIVPQTTINLTAAEDQQEIDAISKLREERRKEELLI
jgi:hypothetical protein